jgi:hypothetical protein
MEGDTMENTSRADKLKAFKVMLAGIKSNGDRMAKRAIDAEFMTKNKYILQYPLAQRFLCVIFSMPSKGVM